MTAIRINQTILPALLLAGMTLSAATPAQAYKDDVGMLVGAGLGGLLGNQFGGGTWNSVATGLGVFLGGVGGRSIGASLDRADAGYYQAGYRTGWTEPSYSRRHVRYYDDVDNYQPTYVAQPAPQRIVYIQQPQPVYARAEARYCREYQSTVQVGNRLQSSYGTACQQPDGSWEIIQ